MMDQRTDSEEAEGTPPITKIQDIYNVESSKKGVLKVRGVI